LTLVSVDPLNEDYQIGLTFLQLQHEVFLVRGFVRVINVPILSPLVWALHAPDDAIPCDDVDVAFALVKESKCVVMPDYPLAIRTLIALGATAEDAMYRADVARQGPQFQDSYDPESNLVTVGRVVNGKCEFVDLTCSCAHETLIAVRSWMPI
jgi:hypothetical protein